ncbi:Peptidyl-prolyl cis-trans isomerase CWC27 like protein [Eufriesea mexicana]|uniref:Peptidyl-prolyl cis-trans isomerase CWC27 like protein n=1 Tax=Eufriesea mexicana TaxID=516756 RepID=A0A310S814_9HYME|nr:Peptidyl-prolyl cis-trans isomerase CWC27 like protein [Eufriesea mexicana]
MCPARESRKQIVVTDGIVNIWFALPPTQCWWDSESGKLFSRQSFRGMAIDDGFSFIELVIPRGEARLSVSGVWNRCWSSTPDLQNKNTIFSRVTEESVYSMLKLEEALVDENDKPLYPTRLIKTIILNNPFSDIIPRIIVQECEDVKDRAETETAGVKHFNLLSCGEKAEKDEEESLILNKKFVMRVTQRIITYVIQD